MSIEASFKSVAMEAAKGAAKELKTKSKEALPAGIAIVLLMSAGYDLLNKKKSKALVKTTAGIGSLLIYKGLKSDRNQNTSKIR